MNELLNELLTWIDSGEVRIQPYTLDDSQRSAGERKIADWMQRARTADFTARQESRAEHWAIAAAIDPQHCYLCDRPKLDCACTLEESESPV